MASLTTLHRAPCPEELLLTALGGGAGIVAQHHHRAAATGEADDSDSAALAAWASVLRFVSAEPVSTAGSVPTAHDAATRSVGGRNGPTTTSRESSAATAALDALSVCVEAGVYCSGLARPATDILGEGANGANALARASDLGTGGDDSAAQQPNAAPPPLPAQAETARQLFLEPDAVTALFVRHHPELGRRLLRRALEALATLVDATATAADAAVASRLTPLTASSAAGDSDDCACNGAHAAFALSSVLRAVYVVGVAAGLLATGSAGESDELNRAAVHAQAAMLMLTRPRFHVSHVRELRARFGGAFSSAAGPIPDFASAASAAPGAEGCDGTSSAAAAAVLAGLGCIGSPMALLRSMVGDAAAHNPGTRRRPESPQPRPSAQALAKRGSVGGLSDLAASAEELAHPDGGAAGRADETQEEGAMLYTRSRTVSVDGSRTVSPSSSVARAARPAPQQQGAPRLTRGASSSSLGGGTSAGSVSGASTSTAGRGGSGRGSLRDFLIRVLMEAAAPHGDASGPWAGRVEPLAVLSRLLLGVPPAASGSGSQHGPAAQVAAFACVGVGPDRRAVALFGSQSLHHTLDALLDWARVAERALTTPAAAPDNQQQPADAAPTVAATWGDLRLQGTFAVGPLLADVLTHAMTCGLAREWPNAVPMVHLLASAYACGRAAVLPSRATRDGKGCDGAEERRAGRGVSFAAGAPRSKPSTQAAARPSARFGATEVAEEVTPATVTAERLAAAPVALPALAALLSLAGACRALVAGASSGTSGGSDRADPERARGAAVAELLPRCLVDLRVVGLYGARDGRLAENAVALHNRISAALGSTSTDASARAQDAADDAWRSTAPHAVLSAFRTVCRAVAAACPSGGSALPPMLQRFLAPALMAQQPPTSSAGATAYGGSLPASITSSADSLALRASDAERWVVLYAAGQLARTSSALRASLCNMSAPRALCTVALPKQGCVLPAAGDDADHGAPRADIPSWHEFAMSAVAGGAVTAAVTSPQRAGRSRPTAALQPLHVAPEQRAVRSTFSAIAAASAAGLVVPRRNRRPADDDHEHDSDDSAYETDEEEELVIVDPRRAHRAAAPIAARRTQPRRSHRGVPEAQDEDDLATTVTSLPSEAPGPGRRGYASSTGASTAQAPWGAHDDGNDAPRGWTPTLAAHWLLDSAARWACRARLFAETDVLLPTDAAAALRAAAVRELLRMQAEAWIPIAADLPPGAYGAAPESMAAAAAPWYRSTDALLPADAGAAPFAKSHHMFERSALPPVVAAAVGEVATCIAAAQASDIVAALTSAQLCAAASAAALARARWGGTQAVTSQVGTSTDPMKPEGAGGADVASDSGSPQQSGSGVGTLTQRAGSVWGGGTMVSGGSGGGGPSRKQRAAIIEQLTTERDQLREELQQSAEEARVAEARAARAAAERDSLAETTERLYVRVVALANALTAARDQCAESRAASSGTFAMLSREREAHDAAVARQAAAQDDLAAARDSIHALEARLVAERQDSESRAEHAAADIAAMARRIEELEAQAAAREKHVAGLEDKLAAMYRLSAAIGGLAGQMGVPGGNNNVPS